MIAMLGGVSLCPSPAWPQPPTPRENRNSPAAQAPAVGGRLTRLAQMDDRELSDALIHARRIDRTGQILLKRRAICRLALTQAELEMARLAARDDVRQCDELVSAPEVQAQLAEMKRMSAFEMQTAYKAFLTKYRLDNDTLRECLEMRLSQKTVERGKKKLAEIEQQIREHENNAPLSLTALDIRRGRPWQLLDQLDMESAAGLPPAPSSDPTLEKNLAIFLEALTK